MIKSSMRRNEVESPALEYQQQQTVSKKLKEEAGCMM
jgi:hypothetical protein